MRKISSLSVIIGFCAFSPLAHADSKAFCETKATEFAHGRSSNVDNWLTDYRNSFNDCMMEYTPISKDGAKVEGPTVGEPQDTASVTPIAPTGKIAKKYSRRHSRSIAKDVAGVRETRKRIASLERARKANHSKRKMAKKLSVPTDPTPVMAAPESMPETVEVKKPTVFDLFSSSEPKETEPLMIEPGSRAWKDYCSAKAHSFTKQKAYYKNKSGTIPISCIAYSGMYDK